MQGGGSSSPSPSSGLCCVGVRVQGGTGGLATTLLRACASAEVGEQGAGERLSRGEGSAEPPARRRSRKQQSGKGWGMLRGCPSICSAPVPKPAGSTGLGQQACKDSEWAGGELMDEGGPAPKATGRPAIGSQRCFGVPVLSWGPCSATGTLRCSGIAVPGHRRGAAPGAGGMPGVPRGKRKGHQDLRVISKGPRKNHAGLACACCLSGAMLLPGEARGCCMASTLHTPMSTGHFGVPTLAGEQELAARQDAFSLGSFLGPGWQEAGGSDAGSRAGIQPGAQRRRC